MIDTIYIEEAIKNHPRTKFILKKFKNSRIISINKYGELFNKRNQNFRIQKANPNLILAHKKDIEKIIKNCETSNSVINVLNTKIKNNLVNWSKF